VTHWLGFLELATLAGLVFAALAVAATTALSPLLLPRLRRWHPRRAAQIALVAAGAPAWAPALGVALCLVPGVLGGAGIGEDHCTHHGGHAHLCLHHPAVAQGGAAAALLATSALAGGIALLRGARSLVTARRAVSRLERAGPGHRAGEAHVLASAAPFSLALGALRPRIVISEGLVAALSPTGLACVLAHEAEHARRRDALRALLARACSWPHPPRMRRALLASLRLAAERACDEAAALRVGDRLLVAETILAVERLARRHPPASDRALACAFGESDVPPRVEALLAAPVPAPPRRLGWAAAAGLAALCLAAAGTLHHAVEHLLGVLLALL
jgi:hypothetical protein